MTFAKTSMLALAATLVTVPAFADPASLARSVGVEPGVYSVAQLIELKSLDDGEQARRNFILDNPEGAGDTVASRSAVEGAGLEGKLAGSVGVEPGLYSVEQLVQLKALVAGCGLSKVSEQRSWLMQRQETGWS